jgi:hypothetical protein
MPFVFLPVAPNFLTSRVLQPDFSGCPQIRCQDQAGQSTAGPHEISLKPDHLDGSINMISKGIAALANLRGQCYGNGVFDPSFINIRKDSLGQFQDTVAHKRF